jgi:uncharacterized protein (DUF2126 family)/transglutaminase-like putative cysteine protease
MAIHVALYHKTHYTYDRAVAHHPHTVRLRPAPHCRTPILSYAQRIRPKNHFLNWQQDPFSNYLARLVFPEKTKELLIEVDLVAEMSVYNPFDFFLEPGAENFPFAYEPALKKDLGPFLETTPAGPLFDAFLASVDRSPTRTNDFLVALNRRLSQEVRYVIRLEAGVQSPETTLELRSGSCRDSAWLMVNLLRHLGLAARFVSGYLIQLSADVKALDGPAGPVADFTDLHAWTEVFLPGAGWIGLDATSGLLAGEGHIPLACSPEPQGAAPVTGAVDECETVLQHEMRVTRISESPRVTKPYTEEQWARIDQLGQRVDEDLERHDVRLTMGGEPTFVSVDHMEGAEWNFTALGPEKRSLSEKLIRRLKDKFSSGALLHYGQGKWYPGESLPRWALACYWRKDGQPIWRDDSLFAVANHSYGHGEREAIEFIAELSRLLGVKSKYILPAYEDAWYYLWRERRLPSNVDPLQSRLEDAEERRRLGKIFDQGLNKIAGYVLPLEPAPGGAGWKSGRWFLRAQHLFLLPGDSPIGLRLPLDALPWVAPEDYPYTVPPDPMRTWPPLPPAVTRGEVRWQFTGVNTGTGVPVNRRPEPGESADWIVRTALCVEARDGRLCVFIPPLSSMEAYLDLIAAIERTAAGLQLPVVLEGSPPPRDPRLHVLKVTPDPGVVEVNLHPAQSWSELVKHTNVLYEEARTCRLGTEKFMLDGRHVGTGGGNHIVLGGPTAADSPILRRPDLLMSLLGYWQNHPSLSFLFSGLFIGPTSQHPRIDEARNDSLYELEVAFRQVPERAAPPWLVDRVFRNLLIDSSGNTHRAEFCIDKLYAPESAAGRLGLVEMRAFEMPPHARMSLAQQLLLRALIARFWNRPRREALVRWGTALHDRFMLPHFVEQDFRDVLTDLREQGYDFDPEWFAPHLEFRFPLCGSVTHQGVNLEVRQALEPWHVLGEDTGAGGATRYVDSSLERLQVKVRGMIDSRHRLACNGYEVPLHPTGTGGEFVAGVRFRAWQPPNCLHPTIGPDGPLTFDIVDGWSGRSVGGCVYHVSHPGGRTYEVFPVNAYEAESRRLSRFAKIGHTPGAFKLASAPRNPEFPMTLDLRAMPKIS